METEIPKTIHFGKIVATIGPASESEECIAALVDAGADVFRLNFSHGSHEVQGKRVTKIRKIEKHINKPIGIIADLQGPKLRIGTFATDDGVILETGTSFEFHLEDRVGDENGVSLKHPEIFKAAKVGMDILVDDGRLQFKVDTVSDTVLHTTVVTGGQIKQKKGVNIPTVQLPIDAVTAKDKKDLAFVLSQDVDWIALSFVQKPEDIQIARELAGDKVGIIAKIEKPSAVDHIENIIKEVDAIMIARGDLGVEIPPEEVPSVQKKIIIACRSAGKPVIVATHLLDSMVASPYPTRAEVSDVANALYDGTDAVMLSAETAAGDYPIKSVTMMRRIIRRTVNDANFFPTVHRLDLDTIPCGTAPSAATQKEIKGKMYNIATASVPSFNAAVCYARQRPEHPLFAAVTDDHLARHLTLVWGIFPIHTDTIDVALARAQAEGVSGADVGTITLE